MQSNFQYHDPLPLQDQEVIKYFFLLQQIVSPLHELQLAIINNPQRTRLSFGVALPIIDRSLEITRSMVLLLSRNNVRDASVLFLNMYELKLDLTHIANEPARADDWIDWNNKSRKPWKVRQQQMAIYDADSDFEIEARMYRDYSMIKHGNNAGSHNAFKFSMKGEGLIINTDAVDMIIPQVISVAITLYVTGKNAIKLLESEGNSYGEFYDQIEKAYLLFRNRVDSDIESIIYEQIFRQYPELTNDSEIKSKLRIEIVSSGEGEGIKINVTQVKK